MGVEMNIYIYNKKNYDQDKLVSIVRNLFTEDQITYSTFMDTKWDFMMYSELKKHLKDENDIVVIPSINVLGADKIQVYQELSWFEQKKILLTVADYPSTCTIDTEKNHQSLRAVMDVIGSLLDNKTFDIRNATETGAGRKNIQFPEGWIELYEEWSTGNITAREFMEKAGLKKGTFYHLLSEYKELMKYNDDLSGKSS